MSPRLREARGVSGLRVPLRSGLDRPLVQNKNSIAQNPEAEIRGRLLARARSFAAGFARFALTFFTPGTTPPSSARPDPARGLAAAFRTNVPHAGILDMSTIDH
jgi:hypothetical protein